MASYGAAPTEFREERSFGRAASQDDSEVSLKLANALRKMDGLIGDLRYAPLRLATQPSTSSAHKRLLAPSFFTFSTVFICQYCIYFSISRLVINQKLPLP